MNGGGCRRRRARALAPVLEALPAVG